MKLKADQIRRLKTCEITFNSEYLFTVVVPQTDYIRVQTEYNGELSNAVGGETLEEILEVEHAIV
jgi:hypothetical protein